MIMFVFLCFCFLKNYRCDVDELVDLNDLTWEQKEQVLRELFARMNGNKAKKANKLNGEKPLAIENVKSKRDSFDSNDDDNDLKQMDRVNLKRPEIENMEKNKYL